MKYDTILALSGRSVSIAKLYADIRIRYRMAIIRYRILDEVRRGSMMKKITKYMTTIFATVSLLACLGACGSAEPEADAVKEDLNSYLSQMETIQPVQQQAINEYNSYVNSADSDSQELLAALNDSIIPTYQSYLTQLNAVTADTSEVQAVKAVCVDGADKQLEALNKVVEAIDACDASMLSEADVLIADSENLFSDYETQLTSLASQHEINLISSRTTSNDTGESDSQSDEDAGTEVE